jgi:ectoine hydroxylase-related dioxygenase (phytanoyl-CoA dioxygenase family)
VLGAGRWKLPKRGGQLVVTFPEPGVWTLPTRPWHTDAPYTEPLEPVFGALVFEFLERVDAGGGGTLVLAGSHRIAARYAASRPAVGMEKMATTRKAFLRSHPWLIALTTDDSEPEARMERFSEETEIDGLPARVVELTGEPGDVVVTHPLMVHCVAPNRGDGPRVMRIRRPRVMVI